VYDDVDPLSIVHIDGQTRFLEHLLEMPEIAGHANSINIIRIKIFDLA
jgi:hypothetical protein